MLYSYLTKIVLLVCLSFCVTFCAIGQTPAAIETTLSTALDNSAKYGSYGGASDADKLAKNIALIEETMKKNATRSDILHYSFPKLKDKMYIATSRDGRFRIYSWDLEDGGSMHNFENLFQYMGRSGKVNMSMPGPDDGGGFYYTDIFQTDGPSGPIYIVASTSIGSHITATQAIETYTIDGDKLDDKAKFIKTTKGLTNSITFAYDPFSVMSYQPERLVLWNAATKSFRFPVVIEDEKDQNGRVTKKYITYKFNGKYFVKVS
ncbi:MAG: hypothetical protein ACJ73D_04200 [Pyrinomonadaceae bacterium]